MGHDSAAPLSICFVAQNGLGALRGEQTGFIGGIERQQSTMARWLAGRGHVVSMVTWDMGQEDGLVIDGVRVFKLCARADGWPGLRFFTPRWTSLVAALGRANARLYYQNAAEYVTGQIALWTRWRRRSFVYTVASEPDCDARLPNMHTVRERILYRYGLRHADEIIVQTCTQGRLLREGFGVGSHTIPMPCLGPSEAEYAAPQPAQTGSARVAWIGRIAPVKRLELLLEVARQMPGVTFTVAGPWDQDSTYAARHRAAAESLPNVQVVGRLRREELDSFYRTHHALCCTSAYEGFPNTFIEAWSYGLPVVSTVDPDRLIEERNLGAKAEDAGALAVALRKLLSSPSEWLACSTAARRYFVENHAFDRVMPRFEELFRRTVHAQP